MWHNLRKVDGLYREAFDKKLCLTKDLVSAVEKRHDIVHRNGKTKDGTEVEISKEDVIKNQQLDRVFTPDMAPEEREAKRKGWNKAVKYAYGWAKDEEEPEDE